MNILAPSMLSLDFRHMEEDLLAAYNAGARQIHVDVMDGNFVPNISFGPPVIKYVRKVLPDVTMDMHLMVTEPGRYMDKWKACGADIVTFHIEAVMDPVQMVRSIHENEMRAGVAIKPATPVSAIEEIITEVDMILIMSVEPGFGGQSFMPVALDKIRETVLLLEEYGLKTDIEVDGGINLKNVDEILEAGANVIVTGSAIFDSDITSNVLNFRKHLEG